MQIPPTGSNPPLPPSGFSDSWVVNKANTINQSIKTDLNALIKGFSIGDLSDLKSQKSSLEDLRNGNEYSFTYVQLEAIENLLDKIGAMANPPTSTQLQEALQASKDLSTALGF